MVVFIAGPIGCPSSCWPLRLPQVWARSLQNTMGPMLEVEAPVLSGCYAHPFGFACLT